MLMRRDELCFLLVDVQEKLYPAIHNKNDLLDNCAWLLSLAKELAITTIVSEQYPSGLGNTLKSLKDLSAEAIYVDKMHFSCAESAECKKALMDLNKSQIVVFGIEAHVCVLQTVLGFIAQGLEVFVVADAISSRDVKDKELAIQRMRDNGAHIVSKEMVFFECLYKSGTEEFKKLSKKFFPRSK